MRNSDTIISLHKVSLTLAGPARQPVPILHDINMQVQRGETVSIVGPSGSGKTSLLMLIAGVEQETSGRITVGGEDITGYSEDALARFRRKNIAVVFQHFHLIPTMNASENVAIALELAGHDNVQARAEDALVKVGLERRLQHYPEQLSGGEQQRVALARAYATRPALLLADEPTGNLDSENGKHIIDLLFSMQQEHGSTLLLITHDMELAGKTARRLRIQDGKLDEA